MCRKTLKMSKILARIYIELFKKLDNKLTYLLAYDYYKNCFNQNNVNVTLF